MHANGWSEDLAWNRNRELNPRWIHWFRLIACMGTEVTGLAHNGLFSGTIHALGEPRV